METAQEIWDFLVENVGPHLPFIAYTFGFAFFGQLAKRFVWTEKNIRRLGVIRDRLWNAGGARRVPAVFLKVFVGTPIPLHPIITGLMLGILPVPISAGLDHTFLIREVYIFGAALLSLALYDVIHSVLRKKGLDFKLPGEASDPPPPPPEENDEEGTEEETRGGP